MFFNVSQGMFFNVSRCSYFQAPAYFGGDGPSFPPPPPPPPPQPLKSEAAHLPNMLWLDASQYFDSIFTLSKQYNIITIMLSTVFNEHDVCSFSYRYGLMKTHVFWKFRQFRFTVLSRFLKSWMKKVTCSLLHAKTKVVPPYSSKALKQIVQKLRLHSNEIQCIFCPRSADWVSKLYEMVNFFISPFCVLNIPPPSWFILGFYTWYTATYSQFPEPVSIFSRLSGFLYKAWAVETLAFRF